MNTNLFYKNINRSKNTERIETHKNKFGGKFLIFDKVTTIT